MRNERLLWLLTILIVVGCLLLSMVAIGLVLGARTGRRETTPPIVTIIPPPHGARVGVGAATTIQVQAVAPGDPLVRLQLWADGQLAGDLPAGGSTVQTVLTWTPHTPGDHTLMAQAYTRWGGTASASVRIQAVEASDRDSDGVPDDADACPDQVGPLQAQGCTTVTEGDRDGDGVLDSQDQCSDDFGLAANGGCPQPSDRDGDGFADGVDGCPDQAGSPDEQGCPVPGRNDQDGDGVTNDQDQCDGQPGSAGTLGCSGPSSDRDGDGMANDQDQCPDVAGVRENDGCPLVGADDQDGDSVPDDQDECALPGSPDSSGCPGTGDLTIPDYPRWLCALSRIYGVMQPLFCTDSDGDGLTDADDRCPQEAGPASRGGCALLSPGDQIVRGGPTVLQCSLFPSRCADSDGDGVVDAEDGCPTIPGNILGCPGFEEYEGEVTGPQVDVQVRLGERLYTRQDWMSVYCYVEVEGLSPLRLPWDRHSLERETSFVWNLGSRRSVDLTTDQVVLRLVMRCFGASAPEGPEVYLGRVVRDHPRDDWDGRTREAVSEGGTDAFTVYYSICEGDCD